MSRSARDLHWLGRALRTTVALATLACTDSASSVRDAATADAASSLDAGLDAATDACTGCADAGAHVDATSCPDTDAGLGCCILEQFCGVMLGPTCYPRMALVLDTIYCDGAAPDAR